MHNTALYHESRDHKIRVKCAQVNGYKGEGRTGRQGERDCGEREEERERKGDAKREEKKGGERVREGRE